MNRKLYLLLVSVMTGNLLFSQDAQLNTQYLLRDNKSPRKNVQIFSEQKNFDNPVFDSDFSDPSDWIVGNDNGFPAEEDNWVIGSDVVPSGPFSISQINSTTSENGYALFDSDAYCTNYDFPYPAQDAWIQTAEPIDLSSANDFSIQFETFYRAFQGECFLDISTDGNVWIQTTLLEEIDVNDFSDNPELVTFFVPELSNLESAFIRFRYTGACDYAWMIDDVKIAATPEFDISITDAWYDSYIITPDEATVTEYIENLEYSEYSTGNVRPLTFIADVTNGGTGELTGVVLEVTVTTPDGPESFQSDPLASLESFDTAVLEIPDVELAAFANGGVLGEYIFEFNVVVNETESDQTNNVAVPKSFLVNDEYMANDLGNFTGGTIGLADDVTWANQFYMTGETQVDYIAFALIDESNFESAEGVPQIITTQEGEVLNLNITRGSVQDEEGGDNQIESLFEEDEIEYVISSDDLTPGTEINWIVIPLPETTALEANEIYQGEVIMPPLGEDYALMSLAQGQEGLAGTYLTPDDLSGGPQGWWNIGNEVPAIRLGFANLLGNEDFSDINFTMGQNYPNPISTGETRIPWSLYEQAENVIFTVTDNTGRTIIQLDLGDRPAGVQEDIILSPNELASGVYQYGLRVGNNKIVRKMLVTH